MVAARGETGVGLSTEGDGLKKLNIGCGGRSYPGYTGIDAVARDGADIVAPAHEIPLPDGCAEEVMAIHLVEHLLPWLVPVALAEWYRLLAPGGKLVLEMPDIIKCCQNIIDGRMKGGKHPDQLGMWGAYGDTRTQDEFMLHRYGWHFGTLAPLVKDAGFVKVREVQTVFHPAGRTCRDFRLEAIRG